MSALMASWLLVLTNDAIARHGSTEMRTACVRIFEDMGQNAKPYWPSMNRLLRYGDRDTEVRAAALLWKLGKRRDVRILLRLDDKTRKLAPKNVPEWDVSETKMAVGECLHAASIACYYQVIGIGQNECFYRGMPTSYWREQVRDGGITPVFSSRVQVQRLGFTWGEGRDFSLSDGCDFPLSDGDPKCIPVLIELLRDSNATIRMYAAQTLGSFGPEAKGALPALERLRNDPEIGAFGTSVGCEAHTAIQEIRKLRAARSNALRRLAEQQESR